MCFLFFWRKFICLGRCGLGSNRCEITKRIRRWQCFKNNWINLFLRFYIYENKKNKREFSEIKSDVFFFFSLWFRLDLNHEWNSASYEKEFFGKVCRIETIDWIWMEIFFLEIEWLIMNNRYQFHHDKEN